MTVIHLDTVDCTVVELSLQAIALVIFLLEINFCRELLQRTTITTFGEQPLQLVTASGSPASGGRRHSECLPLAVAAQWGGEGVAYAPDPEVHHFS